MEHQRRMGKNATTYRRKESDTKQITKNGPNNPKTTTKNNTNKNDKCVETSNHIPPKNKKRIKYAEHPEITPPEINKYKQNKRKLIKQYKDEITI